METTMANKNHVSVTIKRQKIEAANLLDLRRAVREFIDSNGYGASDVGGRWPVRGGVDVSHISYNGRFWNRLDEEVVL